MKYLLAISFCVASCAQAATTPTKAVIQEVTSKAVTDSLVVPSGKSITINAGGSIINNGTSTGFGGAWGSITGTLSDQTDLQTALDAKQPSIAAGTTAQYWRGDKTWQTLNAAAVGLGNVENTALSTWAGSANLTTLGTISSGIWHGTDIEDTYISSAAVWNAKESALTFSAPLSRVANTITLAASGIAAGSYGSSTQVARYTIDIYGRITAVVAQTITPAESLVTFTDITTNNASTTKHGYLPKLTGNAAQYLDGTGAWSAPPSGITIGSTVISGSSNGDILTSNGSAVQKITPGTGVSTALANPIDANSGLLTYDIIGTSGAKVPLLSAANTFASGQKFGGSSGDYFALASSGTRELRLSSNAFSLGPANWLLGMYDSGSLAAPSSSGIYFETQASFRGDVLFYANLVWNANNLTIAREGDYHAFLRLSTNANRWSVANTYTSSTNYESGGFDWQTVPNILRIGSDVGSGGGTARDVSLVRGGVEKACLTSGGFAIGASGAAISKVLTGTATLDFDLTAAVVADLTLTVTGAAVGDVVVLGVPNASITTTAQYTAWVSASNTVTVRCRTSATGEDPASGTFRTTIIQH